MDKQELLEWIKDNKGKVIAIIIACVYMLTAFIFGNQWDWLKVACFLLFPLACIFFSEAMGGYTGMTGLNSPFITRTTPGFFVALAGWTLLSMPLIIAILSVIFHWE